MKKNIAIILVTLLIYNLLLYGFFYFCGNPWINNYMQAEVKRLLRSMYFGEFTIEKSQYDFRSKIYIVIASNGYYRKKVEVSPTERESGGLPVIKEMEELNENVVEKHDFNNLDMNN